MAEIGGSASPLTREEIAKREIGQTNVRPATARTLVLIFLLAIAIVPAYEWVTARAAAPDVETAWSHLFVLPGEVNGRLTREDIQAAGSWSRVVAANRVVLAGLESFETALEDESRLGRLLRPSAQLLLSGSLGAGNERAYIGRDGWVFYRPDVEYLTGQGFLESAQLARRVAAASEWDRPPQPDPRTAIAEFKQQLERRGITLVVMPTPVKPTIHPERLAAAYAGRVAPLQNASYAAFISDLRRERILVFDVADVLIETARRSRQPQYLATDTHWRPETVELVADRLAAFLDDHAPLPVSPAAGYTIEPREVRHTGDIVQMLDLPDDQTLYSPESVSTRRVLTEDGSPWRSDRAADVLVLGDSFSNIYSLASLGWGGGAGLVEQLSYVLQRPIDRIVQNDAGAHATREMLRGQMQRARAGGADRLAGKRVVIWQFAVRELAFGDWKLIELPH